MITLSITGKKKPCGTFSCVAESSCYKSWVCRSGIQDLGRPISFTFCSNIPLLPSAQFLVRAR